MRVVSYGGSYIGRRPNNEDSIGRTIPRDSLVLKSKGRLYLVCDGMGGTKGGEVASKLAVETIVERYYASEGDSVSCLQGAIREASLAIARAAGKDSALADMGSTVVALVVVGDNLIHAHVGDSRAYLLRCGKLTRLTRDHLHILDELGVSEQDAETHPHKNILSRALGYLDASEPDCELMGCISEDRILLCSDGLSDAVTNDRIHAALEQSTPEAAVELLLGDATTNDAHDNTTALVVYIMTDDGLDDPTQRVAFANFGVLDSPDVPVLSAVKVRPQLGRL